MFERYLKIIDQIGDKFEKAVLRILEDVLLIAQADPAKLVRVVRIIEREERRKKESELQKPQSTRMLDPDF